MLILTLINNFSLEWEDGSRYSILIWRNFIPGLFQANLYV